MKTTQGLCRRTQRIEALFTKKITASGEDGIWTVTRKMGRKGKHMVYQQKKDV